MILLNYGVNQMYLTISEINPFNNPLYYIDIIDETVFSTKRVSIFDTSIYADRYNQYQIEVTGTYSYESLTASIVYLNEGKHKYNVYSSNGIDLQLCETGILQVNKVHTASASYSDNVPVSFTYSSYSDTLN